MKKKSLILIIILIIGLFCGCVRDINRKELGNIDFVQIMGLDKKDGEIIVTALFKVGITENSSGDAKIVSCTGDTVFRAFEDMRNVCDKPITLANANYFIIGHEMAVSGIDNCIDFITRDESVKINAILYVSKEKQAYDFIKETIEEKEFLNRRLDNINNKLILYSTDIGNTISGLLDTLGESNPIMIPYIEHKESAVSINGYALFDKLKLYDYLTPELTMGVNYVRNKIRSAPIFIENELGMLTANSNTKIKTQLKNENIEAVIKIYFTTNVKEVEPKHDIFDLEQRNELTKRQSKYVEDIVLKTISYQKENKIDIMGIGENFKNTNPIQSKKFKGDLNDIANRTNFKIEIKSKISRTFDIETLAQYES